MAEKKLIGVEFTAPFDEPGYRPGSRICAHVALTHLEGNKRPYWSFTADVFEPGRREMSSGGAMTEAIAKHFPDLAPFVDLHLADDSGEPMYAVENGWYHMGEGAHHKEFDVAILARHLRVSEHDAQSIRDGVPAGDKSAFTAIVEGMRPRWKQESDALRAWLSQQPGVYGTLVQKMADFVEQHGITIESSPVKENPLRLSEEKPGQPWLAPNHWHVTLTNKAGEHLSVYFTMGAGHIERKLGLDAKNVWKRETRQFKSNPSIDEARQYMHEREGTGVLPARTRPARPTAAEVLQSLATDIQYLENTRSFDDWYRELAEGTSPTMAKRAYDEIESERERLKSFLGRSAYDVLVKEEPPEVEGADRSPSRAPGR